MSIQACTLRVLPLLLAAGCGDPPPVEAAGPFREITLDQALAAARSESKIVLIDFFTTWCNPCKLLDRTTWKDPAVVGWLQRNAVGIKIDAEQHVDLAKRFEVFGYPTLLLLKPDGSEIDRLIGYRKPADFLSDAKAAVDGQNSLLRARSTSAAAGGEDPMLRMDLARELAQRGKHEEALDHFLWCWDHGAEHDPSFSGVRGSFLLTEIAQLGKRYRPAREALVQRRDELAKTVTDGDASEQRVLDLMALDRHLEDTAHALKVFDALAESGPRGAKVRGMLVEAVAGELTRQRRYDDLLAAAGDVEQRIAQRLEIYELSARAAPDLRSRRVLQELVVEDCAPWIETLLGAGKDELAERLVDRLLEFSDSEATRRTLAERAERCGRAELAERVRGGGR